MEHPATSPDRAPSDMRAEHPAERPTERLAHRMAGFLAIAVAVIAVDQITKSLIRGWLAVGERWPADWTVIQLSHVRNTGAAFGMFQGSGDILIIAALVGIGIMTFYLLTLPAHSRWYTVALSAVLGGAMGNLIDRVRLGHVTDFIDPTHYPAFNVADSAIVCGIITIAVLSFFDDRRAKEPSEGDPPGTDGPG